MTTWRLAFVIVALLSNPKSYSQGPQGSPVGTMPTIEATIIVSKSNPATGSGQQTLTYVRNQHGDTRITNGDRVMITESPTETTYILSLAKKEAIRLVKTSSPHLAPPPGAVAQTEEGTVKMLAPETIEGLTTTGRERIQTLPSVVRSGVTVPARSRTVDEWISTTLNLSIKTVVKDDNGITVSLFKDIRTNVSVDDALFRVPEGFAIKDFDRETSSVK